MDSVDIAHVPPSDPSNWWLLTVGERRKLDGRGDVWLSVISCAPSWGHVSVLFGYQGAIWHDFLKLDKPCNALRHPETGAPMLTFTLRQIEPDRAAIQISAPPTMFRIEPQTSDLIH